MSRLFNVEVFNQTIGAAAPVYSSQEFYALLGSADVIVAQLVLDGVSATSATEVTVTYQVNNTTQEQLWVDTPWNESVTASNADDPPKQEALVVPQGTDEHLGAFGRFKVAADKGGASVRIIACGRST